MTSPQPTDTDKSSSEAPSAAKPPETPRRTVNARRRASNADKPATPIRKASTPAGDGNGDAAPQSAPAAAPRPRAATTKPPPTLWGDFLLGRPSPARQAADRAAARERRLSLDLVKQEMRQEMRQAAVQKVQAPGGVRDRVKKWQKNNADAMADADPFATPTEPSEMNIQVDDESVTEEDRKRIQLRQKRTPSRPPKPKLEHKTSDSSKDSVDNQDTPTGSPPKKRVVSDTNWVKNGKKKSPPKNQPSKDKQQKDGPSPLPKDFLKRTAASPAMANKIKAWADKVEIPDEPVPRHFAGARSVTSLDGIRATPMSSTIGSTTSLPESKTTADTRRPSRPPVSSNDGIRVRPIRKQQYQDDGIRVYPSRETSREPPSTRAKSRDSSRRSQSRITSARRTASPSDRIVVIEDPETPTRANSRKPSPRERRAPLRRRANSSTTITGTTDTRTTLTSSTQTGTTITGTTQSGTTITDSTHTSSGLTGTEVTGDDSDSGSYTGSSAYDSDLPSTALPSQLEPIPFGYSAFSELDLPPGSRGASAQTPRAHRQPSFKGATHVLKKVLNEGKKMVTEKVDPPPKTATNKPPSIETWLKGTVDPFVESTSAHEAGSTNPEHKEPQPATDENRNRRSTSASMSRPEEPSRHVRANVERTPEPSTPRERHERHLEDHTRRDESPTTPTSGGLKRSGATRYNPTPNKPASKWGLKEKIRDAFRGESSGHVSSPPLEYPSCSEIVDVEPEGRHDGRDSRDRRRHSSSRRSPSPEDDSTISAESSQLTPSIEPRRRMPTNGYHELSTIISEVESQGTQESDMTSVVSDSTVTQKPELSRNRSHLSRQRSQRSGLKRRLTKHSDLVSVLSLPEESPVPGRSGSLRSARSVRRTSNHLHDASVDSLLREFGEDEDLYRRELKTLVDGVLPVLITQVVHGDGRAPKDLFGSTVPRTKQDALAKAVVNMGVALEKLKNAHRRCPLNDANKLPQWLDSTYSMYDTYLDAWRLGFQGVIVNLAPAAPDDMDSLVNAMPRNQDGDVLNENGERIDVAHLLKRPLVRIKWITKFIQGYRAVTGTAHYEPLSTKWESLQEKARRRHKEENARAVDDDATFTDTTRVRDLRTLEALDNVRIDRFRQVYAKDSFALDLRHSNGQRLGCQVELISRDNQLFKSDPGDLLIRETGTRGQSWLLFAPVTGGHYSARRGESDREMVVMIRGHREGWSEVFTLTADDEDQVQDWLGILGTSPVPPQINDTADTQSVIQSTLSAEEDLPIGERRRRQPSHSPSSTPTTPNRHHSRAASVPTTPAYAERSPVSSPETTPTQDSYGRSRHEDGHHSRPLSEDMRPDPSSFQKTSPSSKHHREDGAPPPPAHRSLGGQQAPVISPPAEESSCKVKRRTSSPLKHEFHPSDVSSEGSSSVSDSEDDSSSYTDESSDDELEEVDMPETVPAISIKQPPIRTPPESVVSGSMPSVTPSASASQAGGLPKLDGMHPEYLFRSMASISYWDNKNGCWKDLWPDVCSIVTTPGLIEAYPFRRTHTSSGTAHQEEDRPLVALDLTPLVMLRNSTALDLEIRSPVLSYARLYAKVNKMETSFFRFRAPSFPECENLYLSVHRARMDNAKYKALEEETRIRAFGQPAPQQDGIAKDRRSWFGRKNSYRASARAPSQSAGSHSQSSSISATSFLKRIMGGNQSFNIAMSSVDKHARPASAGHSLYDSSSSGASPRSPSVSAANSGGAKMSLTTNNLKIRLHLLVSASKWEDNGNCILEVTRPTEGARQNLRKYQGMEKRIIVTTLPKKETEKGRVVLDVVVGSRCFSRLGSRGILLNVWEENKDASGEVAVAPKDRGNSGGQVNKWCFQCASVSEAGWIFGLVTQEVVIG